MNIRVSQNIPVNSNNKYVSAPSTNNKGANSAVYAPKNNISDTFTKQTAPKKVSFNGIFFNTTRKNKNNEDIVIALNGLPTKYAIDLSSGVKKVMGCDIPASNFKNVMTPSEFKELLPTLKTENFISSSENQESGVYNVDVDYQSTFSSGEENIFDILDNVAIYANNLYEKTGKDFVFSITDRDSLEGLQHALRLFGSEPRKYEHVKLLPGIKMSFAHEAPTSSIGYENSDILIYGINPYSDNIIDFVDTTIEKRKQMIVNFIKQVNNLYPEFRYRVCEFAKQNSIKYKKGYGVSNLYWRAREYAETKGDTEIKGVKMVPDDIIRESDAILKELGEVFVGSNKKIKAGSNIIHDNEVNKTIKDVFNEYSTHYDEEEEKVVSSAENLYNDMITSLSSEKEQPILALASPYYVSHYYEKSNSDDFENVIHFVKKLQEDSKGMLVAFETVAPGYDLDKYLSKPEVKKFNDYMKKHTDLHEVGGSFATREKLPYNQTHNW
jgi:hypothetical protein